MNISIISLVFLLICSNTHAETIVLGDFSETSSHRWQEKVFNKPTVYIFDHTKNTPSNRINARLKAVSRHASSGLIREQMIDLEKTPFLSWSWKVEDSSLLKTPTHNERSKQGDDYVLRLYIIIEDSLFFWRTRVLNYVWSANQPIGSHWPSPYTKKSTILVVNSGKRLVGQWQFHKRNLKKDIKNYLGINDASTVHAVALMSDSDNTQGESVVYFGSIIASSE